MQFAAAAANIRDTIATTATTATDLLTPLLALIPLDLIQLSSKKESDDDDYDYYRTLVAAKVVAQSKLERLIDQIWPQILYQSRDQRVRHAALLSRTQSSKLSTTLRNRDT